MFKTIAVLFVVGQYGLPDGPITVHQSLRLCEASKITFAHAVKQDESNYYCKVYNQASK